MPYRQRALLAIAVEIGYISDLLCSAPADILKLSRREGWFVRSIRNLYWGWSWLVATLSQPLLNWLLSSKSESRFWTSLYRGLMAYTVGDRRAIVPVRPFLTSENTRDQVILLRGIYTEISDPILLEECLRKVMIETKSQNVRWLAAYRLYNLDHKLALSMFVAQLQEKSSPELRSTALNALLLARSHLDDNHLSLIRKTLDDASPIVRDMACFVLGYLRDKDSVRPICRLLRDEEPSVRTSACEALAEISSPESVNYLKPLIADQNEAVRNASYDALWRICRQNGIELLPS
jgi:HEAT repeat protein